MRFWTYTTVISCDMVSWDLHCHWYQKLVVILYRTSRFVHRWGTTSPILLGSEVIREFLLLWGEIFLFSEELKLIYEYITQAVKYAFLLLKKQVERYLHILSNSLYIYINYIYTPICMNYTNFCVYRN